MLRHTPAHKRAARGPVGSLVTLGRGGATRFGHTQRGTAQPAVGATRRFAHPPAPRAPSTPANRHVLSSRVAPPLRRVPRHTTSSPPPSYKNTTSSSQHAAVHDPGVVVLASEGPTTSQPPGGILSYLIGRPRQKHTSALRPVLGRRPSGGRKRRLFALWYSAGGGRSSTGERATVLERPARGEKNDHTRGTRFDSS